MTSLANDNNVDPHLQETYLNDRCAYLTEKLAQHNAQVSMRTRSVSTSDDQRIKQTSALSTRQRHVSAQVLTNKTATQCIGIVQALFLYKIHVKLCNNMSLLYQG